MDRKKVLKEVKSWTLLILIAFVIKSSIFAAYFVPTGSMENTIMTGDFLIGFNFSYNLHTPDRINIPFTRIGFDIPRLQGPGLEKIDPGDIVIFRPPVERAVNYVKRCVAVPGQTLEILDKHLFVDGKEFIEPDDTRFARADVYGKNLINRGIFPAGNGNEDNYPQIYVPAKGDTLFYNRHNFQLIKNVAELAGEQVSPYDVNKYYIVKQNYYFMMGDNRDESYDSRFWGFVPENLIVGKPAMVLASLDFHQKGWNVFNRVRWWRSGKLL
ncbi:MAG: signal peptidase I [Candidatus Marinimicrobia bacterium]|nr:signal peptidase I [Candidatus Neomarinimicrobiota bacterium]